MRYHHRIGATQKPSTTKRWLKSAPFVVLAIGGYVTVTMYAPLLQGIDGRSASATADKLMSVKPGSEGNRLYIPQINVDIPIAEGDDPTALDTSALRPEESVGSPVSGGSMVLGARNLKIGMTPAETKASSPFYHLDKLQPGDELFVDWKGQRYVYEVKNRVMADSLVSLVESTMDKAGSTLALYTANELGGLEGDVAVKAQRVGTVAWGAKPVIQRTDSSATTN